jgi:hypothetical protein
MLVYDAHSYATSSLPDPNIDGPVLNELKRPAINICIRAPVALSQLTSALNVDFMILVQSKSSKPGAICTTQLIGLSGCDGNWRHARLASLGSANVTKAVDTGV